MFSVKISRRVNGKEVSPSEFGSGLKDRVLEMAQEQIRKRVEAVKCPVHGKTGTAELEQGPGDNFSYNVKGCCEELTKAVRKALSASA